MPTEIEKLRGTVAVHDVSMAEIRAVLKELAEGMRGLKLAQDKNEAGMQGLRLAQEKTELSVQKTQAGLQELKEDLKKTQASLRETQASLRETQAALRETLASVRESMKELSGNVSGVNRRLGEVVEMIVLPSLMKKMNALGHNFTMSSPRKRFSRDGEQLAEIDLFLENGGEAMAVEAKARFKLGDVNVFLGRLELLRENEDITGTAGKAIFAAAAAVGFDRAARELASEKGMYLVEIDDDNDSVRVVPPEGAAGRW
jgi:hypothetical protein